MEASGGAALPLQFQPWLSMAGLGVLQDQGPDPDQPPLAQGIHLRWQFGQDRGFPWYGYYLFRRPHLEGDPVCLTGELRGLAGYAAPPLNGALGTHEQVFPQGTFTSDRPLIVTDDFPGAFIAELDLRDRDYLRYQFAQPARRVISRLGFRADAEGLDCLGFTADSPTVARAPREVAGAQIWTRDFDGSDRSTSNLSMFGATFTLDLHAGARVVLPCTATEVVISLVIGNQAGSVVARDAAGRIVAETGIPRPQNGQVTISLHADGMRELTLSHPQNEAQLLSLCWRCSDELGLRVTPPEDEEDELDLTLTPPPPEDDDDLGLTVTPPPENPEDVEVRYYAGPVLIHTETVSGNAGEVVETEFASDLITRVEFGGANAALVEVCYVPVAQDYAQGWVPVLGLELPIALPVRDPQYPASGGQPGDPAASEDTAIDRIRYGAVADWQGARFDEMYAALEDLVDQGPPGLMADIGQDDLVGEPGTPGPQPTPSLERLRLLNTLMLGALEPQVAQMLGLYWVDATAEPGVRYDYLIIADHIGVAAGGPTALLGFLASPQAPISFWVDAWISYDLSLGMPDPLPPPEDLRAFALPGATREGPDGALDELEQNAGLDWHIPTTDGEKLAGGAPVLYRLRRAVLGDAEPEAPVAADQHTQLSERPQAVTDANLPPGATQAGRAADWPPLSLNYIDSGLAEGWYSYRVTAIDIFGRWSVVSPPAQWWQWAPSADAQNWQPPWYHDTAQGDAQVHPHAVRLLDKVAPPPPVGVEAFALDPFDRYLERDQRFDTWFATLAQDEQEGVVGLRVRWLWTFAQMRQAPDTAEFRVYYSAGLANTFKGRIVSVAAQGATASRVSTDIPNGEAAGAWTGAVLRSGQRSFAVTGSQGGDPLVLDVENLGTGQDEVPIEGLRASVILPGGNRSAHPLAADLARQEAWDTRLWVVGIDDHVAEGVVPDRAPDNDWLAGAGATVAGPVATLPGESDLTGVQPLDTHLFLAGDTARPTRLYRIMQVDAAARELTLDAAPAVAGASDWEIGQRVRRYELFLPAPGDADRGGVDLPTSRADPVAYAQLGVTAVDDKAHTADDPARAGGRWGDRPGNEGQVSGPATIHRVHRAPPPAPQVPPDGEAVFASPPDFNRQSYYTVRWVPEPDVMTHVYRALDGTVFDRDWLIRRTRAALSAAEHDDVFPPGWSTPHSNAAAAELNAISGPGSYAGLSADARTLLARLPGNQGVEGGALEARDLAIRQSRSALDAGDAAIFPPDWDDPLVRHAAADQLNAIAARDDYAALSNNALRVLAALPGLAEAFRQITDLPLPNAGPQTENRAGPDNPPGFEVDPALRAYADRLLGRARNRYFYRTAFVDEAQNSGPLGLSSPPVHLHDVAPPRRPVLIRALAGDPDAQATQDRKITLVWASNREPDLVAYHVFRTDTPVDARDTRLMTLVAEIAVPPGDPAARPGENVLVDADLDGLVTFTYRLEAVDGAGNRSAPSDPIDARAFDTVQPEVPPLALSWVDEAGEVRAEASWTSDHDAMLQRETGAGLWVDVGGWQAAGAASMRDPGSDPEAAAGYRLRVRKYTGAVALGPTMPLVPT